MKHHLIMSSSYTGGKNIGHGREIVQALNLNFSDVTVSEFKKRGQAETLCREALRNGAESILVAAGDSTINEVVNGFFEDGKPVADKPRLGIIPTKDGCDFQKTTGTPAHLFEAVSRIESGEPTPIDFGRVITADGKSRYFANVATAGISASIGKSNKRVKWLSEIDGDLAFNWAALTNSLFHSTFPLHVSIPGGPQSMQWDANCVAICNGQSFGGGMRLAPDADLSDGFLDVIVVHDLSKKEFLKSLNQLRHQEAVDPDGISTIRTSSVLLSCDDPERKVPVDADGDAAGYLPARFDVVPAAAMLY